MTNEVDKIEIIRNKWFLEEPAYFLVQSIFRIEYDNKIMKIAAAPKNIFVNKEFADSIPVAQLDAMLRVECLRILLRHPFTRYSSDRDRILSFIASEAVIGTICHIKNIKVFNIDDFIKANNLNTKIDIRLSYEEVYKKLCKIAKKGGISDSDIVGDIMAQNKEEIESATTYWASNGDSSGDAAYALAAINRIIDHIRAGSGTNGKGIGTMHGDALSLIEASDPPFFDYKEPLRRFRHSVIASAKSLTRMKPNRRYGYAQMGSKNSYVANVLLVCDTSGSMSEYELSKFIGFANGFFKSGMSLTNVVQFDTVVMDETLEPLKRKKYKYTFKGRGGTSIEDILDYVNKRSKIKYDGVIVFSDGGYVQNYDAWIESAKTNKTRYVFCITDEDMYDKHKQRLDNQTNIDITIIDINNYGKN